MNNKYFILRHGHTTHHQRNREFVYPKWLTTDSSVKLSPEGKKQIEAAAKKIKKERIDMIYSSDLFRTCQTAKIVSKITGLKIIYDKRLRDINLGVYHGRKKKEFYNDFSDREKRFAKGPKKGESWNDLKKRVKSFLKDVEKKNKKKNILIVSHGDTLWIMEGVIKKLSNKALIKNQLENYIKMGEFRKI